MTNQPNIDQLRDIGVRAHASLRLQAIYADRVLGLTRPEELRYQLAAFSCVLAIEYQGAVANLIHTRHYSAAHVLMRPTFECVARAIWLLYVAKPQDVKSMGEGRMRPDLDALLKYLRAPHLHAIAPLVMTLSGVSGLFSSFTHSCYEQLKRRQDGFPLQEVMACMLLMDTFAIIAGAIFGEIYKDEDLKDMTEPNMRSLIAVARRHLEIPEPSASENAISLPQVPDWPDLRRHTS